MSTCNAAYTVDIDLEHPQVWETGSLWGHTGALEVNKEIAQNCWDTLLGRSGHHVI